MGVERADDGESGGERMELEDRVTLAADRPWDQDELCDRALFRSQDRAEFAGVHVAGRLQDHPQGLAGDRGDALHWRASLPRQFLLDASVEIVPESDARRATLCGGRDDLSRPFDAGAVYS